MKRQKLNVILFILDGLGVFLFKYFNNKIKMNKKKLTNKNCLEDINLILSEKCFYCI